MSLRTIVIVGFVAWAGLTLLLGEVPALRRRSLAQRLAAHTGGTDRPSRPTLVWSIGSLTAVLAPLAEDLGGRLAKAFGSHDELAARLARAGRPEDPPAFRLRQLTRAGVAFVVGLATGSVLSLPVLVIAAGAIGAALLTFLVIEQAAIAESSRWQRRVIAELPVVAEQLGMLLSCGYSLGSAIARIGERGHGVVATGFTRVTHRVRQGLSEIDALREWAELAEVAPVHRLLAVLELNSHASDLGDLISAEARNTRREVHRELEELIERRGQQVWIPVTVATLVPGVIFMAVPFIDAMNKLTGA